MSNVQDFAFAGVALATIVLAYLYQRRERVQAARMIWLWPFIFAIVAAHALILRWPIDARFALLLGIAFLVGVPIGIARAFAFGVRSGEKPGTMVLRPTLLSGSIFLAAMLFNEFEHALHWGQPVLARISCMFLILTVGDSIAVNVTRLLRWKYQHL